MSNPERIHNLTTELNATRTALDAEKARNRSLTDDLLRTAEPNRVLNLARELGPYRDTKTPRVLKLLAACETSVLAAHPLRSAPMTDTARTGHPEDTAVEAAHEALKSERANLKWVGVEMDELIDKINGRVAPDEMVGRDRPERPRCWKRPCRGERGPINARYCPKCGKGYETEDVEEVA